MRSFWKFFAALIGTLLLTVLVKIVLGEGLAASIQSVIVGALFGGGTAYTVTDALLTSDKWRKSVQYSRQERIFWIGYQALSIGIMYSYFGMVWFSMMDEGLLGMAVGFVAGAAQGGASAHQRLRDGLVKRVQRPFAWTFLGVVLGVIYGVAVGTAVGKLYRAETHLAGAIGGAIYGAMHGLVLGGYLTLLYSRINAINAQSLVSNLVISVIVSVILFTIYLVQFDGSWEAIILMLCFTLHLFIPLSLSDEGVVIAILGTVMLIGVVGGLVHLQWQERVLHWKLEEYGVRTWATFDGCDCDSDTCYLEATYLIDDNQTLQLREDVYRGMCRRDSDEILVTYLPDAPAQASVKSHSGAGLGWLLVLPFFSFMMVSSTVSVDAGVAERKKK